MFKSKKIKKSSVNKRKRTFSQKKNSYKKKKDTFFILKWVSFMLVSFLLISIIAGVILYKKYIVPLPPVEKIKNMNIAQTSIIFDKDGNELYKLFKENRTYVDYKDISKNMVNALVAGEDQRFWTTPGFDIIGITRAAIYGIFTGDFKGTSGISQQLMKVTYLTSERSLERKIKEFYLSWKLNKVFDKEKIVELYLNKIFFGSNAYGIEQASQTFFGKNSSDLNILESSILASLPKAPSGLSPYNHKDRLMGYPFTFTKGNEEDKILLLNKVDIDDNSEIVSKLIDFISNLKLQRIDNSALICNVDKKYIKSGTFRVDSDGCITLGFDKLLDFLNAVQIDDGNIILEYQTGRKDYILGRMLEDSYIDFDSYKKSILDSFGFEFQKYKQNIKYPYFVMYIKEYIENKYGKDIVEQGGFRIFTTLDSDLQDEAEKIVEKYGNINETKFGAKNSAMVSIDNENGGILAMVGGRDYFDVENGGNNNMITSRLQPGSSFKPFVYSLAIQNNQIGSKTPIYDLKTRFPGGYIPHNFDGKFMGKMNLSTALNNSRNIPAIKMFYLAGGEDKIISFMEKLGVKTLRKFKEEYKENHNGKEYNYSAPMALGTGLMTPLELAGAYSTFANLGVNKGINPIIKIEDRKGNIIEDRNQNESTKEPSISPALAYIMNNILSDTATRPSFWNTYLSLPDRKLSAKTGTSTKQYTKNGKKVIAPRNLWTIGYTPQITTVAWAGNTSGKELYLNGNGLEAAGPIMRDFMKYAHNNKKVQSWPKPLGVKTVAVSDVSGLLPSEKFPEEFLVNSNFLNTPNKVDNSLQYLEVDSLCNGKVTSDTPASAIKKGYLLNFHSIDPNSPIFEVPVQEWVKKGTWKEKYGSFGNIITEYNNEICPRAGESKTTIKTSLSNGDSLFIGNNNVDVAYISERSIIKIEVYMGDVLLTTIDTKNKTKQGLNLSIAIPAHFSNSSGVLKFKLIDSEYYSYDENVNINVLSTDNVKPIINLDQKNNITYDGISDYVIFTGNVKDSSNISSIKYYFNGELMKEVVNSQVINYKLPAKKLLKGDNNFLIEASDSSANISKKEVKIFVEK